ncbi:MAG: DUF3854 domain-containing protein [Thermodesulfobacteriota bacterium]
MERKTFYSLDPETKETIQIEAVKDLHGLWKSDCFKCGSKGTMIIHEEYNYCYCSGCEVIAKKINQNLSTVVDKPTSEGQAHPLTHLEPEQQKEVIEFEDVSLDLHLSPSHLEDLRKSGLNDNTIKEAGIYSVRPGDISKIFNHPRVESTLAFPYPGTDHIRYKLFSSEPILDKDGHQIKYYQPKGSSNRLYIPEKVRAILLDPSIPLHITEGEKKTLKMNQEGLYCIGLGGLWNWADGSEEKNLIPDFDLIEWKGREVYLDPDNDFLKPDRHGDKKNTGQAVKELAYQLIDRGAKAFIVYLPEGDEKGIDDYLCNHTVAEYKALKKEEIRKYSIDEIIESLTPQFFIENQKEIFKKLAQLSDVEREIKIKAISKKIDVKVTSIKNDFNSFTSKKREDINVDQLLEKCEEGCKVYTAQNYYDGILSYGAVVNGTKIVIESNKNVIQSSKEANMKFARSKFTIEAIKRFRSGENVNGKELHGQLSRLFSDHVIFPDKRIPELLATWVIGTYMYKSFPYFGYLLFVSPTKRCAKSLVEDLLSHVCHNATTRSINPSEASVFRQVDGDDVTLIVDEVESLSPKEKDKKPEMFSLLNSGFQKGSTVTRIESRGKEFFPVSFNAYSPKILAGIRGVSDTIEDRSFKIPMIRKAPGEKVKRFNLRRQEDEIRQLRDDLYIFGLRHGPDVIELYDLMTGKIPGIEGFDDRQKDILEPLACINLIIDELANDKDKTTFNALVELSKSMSQKRISHEKLDGSFTAILEIMEKELGNQDECFILVPRLFEIANTTDGLSFRNTNSLGRYMAKLDIYSSQRKIGKENIRGYSITKAWVEDQKKRYIL